MKRVASSVVAAWVVLLVFGTSAQGQTLATYKIESGWATFGLALPRGAAGEGVRVGGLLTQTDIKTRWPDGSIRFAVVTVRAPRTDEYPITPGPSAPGGFDPEPVTAFVRLMIGGQSWSAALPRVRSDRWLAGPHVVEDRALIAPVGPGGAHPFLRVRYDVRSYAGGGHRVDVSVENMLDVPQTDKVDYNVSIEVNGESVFTQSNVRHFAFTRWRKVFESRGFSEAEIVPDFQPFVRARAIPQYLPSVNSNSYSTSEANFGILKHGNLSAYMGAAGTRPEISPYPDWTAQFLVHRTESQRRYVLRHGELAGSWAVHITSDGTRPISLDERPDFWFDGRGTDKPANDLRGRPDNEGVSSADNAHQPSLAYIPYLVSGDRWFADEMMYWAAYCTIRLWPGGGRGSQGLLWPDEVRGRGWALRNMADAAAYLPEGEPFREYFRKQVQANLESFDYYARETADEAGPIGGIFKFNGFTENAPYWSRSVWEEYQFAWAIDHAMSHGDYPPGVGATIRERLVRLCMRTLTSEAEGFPREWAGPYKLALGTYSGGTYTYFSTMAQVYEGTRVTNGPGATPLTGDWYGVQIRFMTILGQRLGLPRASESYAWLMGLDQAGESLRDTVNRRSGWAIAADGTVEETSSRPAPRTPPRRPSAPRNLRIVP